VACGREFKTTVGAHKRCGALECMAHSGNCVICGIVFHTNRVSQKTCSRDCSNAHKKNLAAESQKRHWARVLAGKLDFLPPYLKLRFETLKRDGFACCYCGRTPQDGTKLHIDHVIPRAAGGTHDPENLKTACEECNLGKGDVLLDERAGLQTSEKAFPKKKASPF